MNTGAPFPDEFDSDWMDIGSRTVDPGHRFVITVDESGYFAERKFGEWTVEDLFGECAYWPTLLAWSGSHAVFGSLLRQVAESLGMEPARLVEMVAEVVDPYDEYEIRELLLAETDDTQHLGAHRKGVLAALGTLRVPGLPSDLLKPGTCFAGLELEYAEDAWHATLFIPEPDDPMFLPEQYSAPRFGELCDTMDEAMPGSQEELAALLIESDERWRPFVGDFDHA